MFLFKEIEKLQKQTYQATTGTTRVQAPLIALSAALTPSRARKTALSPASYRIRTIKRRAHRRRLSARYRTSRALARLTTIVFERLTMPVDGALVIAG